MAYDQDLANRIREILADRSDVTEQKMFGGLAFMVGGHLCVAASGREGQMLVRVGSDAQEQALAQPHTRDMAFSNRTMKGYIYVDAPGIASDDALSAWVERALTVVETLPPK